MINKMKQVNRLVWIFFVCGVGSILLLAPRAAQAHAEYEHSDPPADSVIPSPPDTVRIWFTQELFRREGANWIEVAGPDGSQVQVGDAVVDDDDRTLLSVGLQTGLGAGEYQVRWHSLSADDADEDEGEFTFRVDPSAQESTALPPPTTAPTPSPFPSEVAGTATSVPPTENGPSSGLPCLGSALFGLGMALLAWRLRAR